MSTEGFATSAKHLSSAWAGLSDEQKQAVVDQTHAQNVKYLQDFEARHGDPRSLPVIKIETYQPPPASLGAAVAQATVIVHGTVRTVHFIASPEGGSPQMTATVSVHDVGKGSVAGSTILVKQSGGPVAKGGQGALVRLEDEELILPGDEVVLLLTRSHATTPEYRAIYGAGVQFVRNGKFSGESAKRYGVDGQSFAAVWKSVTDPELGAGAFPLQARPGI